MWCCTARHRLLVFLQIQHVAVKDGKLSGRCAPDRTVLCSAVSSCAVGVVFVFLQIEHVSAKDGKLRRLTQEEEVVKEVQQVRGREKE